MPKVVKMGSADARAWRENQAQWVSPEGQVVRAVTPEEEAAMFPAIEAAKRIKQNGTKTVAARYKKRLPNGSETFTDVPLVVQLQVTKTGRDQNAVIVTAYVNGHRYVKGRDIVEARILAEHGECILQGTNGKQLTVIRDPRVSRASYEDSQRNSPSPDRCHCKGFSGNPNPDRHHIVCEWNSKCPPHERALPVERSAPTPTLLERADPIASLAFAPPPMNGSSHGSSPQLAASDRAARTPAAPVIPGQLGPRVLSGPPPQRVYANPPPPPNAALGLPTTVAQTPKLAAPVVASPEECPKSCGQWPWPDRRKPLPREHHPLCPHHDAWEAEERPRQSYLVRDIQTGQTFREATSEEVAQSQINLARLGIPSVEINGALFEVVPAEGTIRKRHPVPAVAQEDLRALPAGAVVTGAAALDVPGARPAASADDLDIAALEALLAKKRAAIASLPAPAPSAAFEASLEELTTVVSESAGPLDLTAYESPYNEERPPVLPAARIIQPTTADVTGQVPPPILVQEDPTLRDEKGLVGKQQASSQIPKGPVILPPPPEAFVDPLERKDVPTASAPPPPPPAPPMPPG